MQQGKMIIVTTGQPFTDIDSLASSIAYTELLNLIGKNAECILPGPLNGSITKKIKSWNLKSLKSPRNLADKYVLVDISEPKFFAKFVKEDLISEVYDHRKGFEEYWKERIGKNSHIEMVGSCATLIWERFVEEEFSDRISKVSANLLYTAIASNTLNFQSSVTTPRDKKAFSELEKHINIPKTWIRTYFLDVQKEIDKDVKTALINDTKNISPIIGQLEFWDSKKIIFKHLKEIREVLESFGDKKWFFTSPSISEGRNYLYTENDDVKKMLKKVIGAKFNKNIGTTKKLWLRKEIFAKL